MRVRFAGPLFLTNPERKRGDRRLPCVAPIPLKREVIPSLALRVNAKDTPESRFPFALQAVLHNNPLHMNSRTSTNGGDHMKASIMSVLFAATFFCVPSARAQEKPIRIGMIGLDTSHCEAFTKILHNPKNEGALAGF